jgi:hypothetical protein
MKDGPAAPESVFYPVRTRASGLLSALPVHSPGEQSMSELTPEEEHERTRGAPWGTFVLMLLVGALLFAGWAFMFFKMFLPNGPVN